jgi:hypothetical protein
MVKVIPGKFRVMRNCCTSGNCVECNGKTPVGTPMRVAHMENISAETARRVAENFSAYRAVVEPMPMKLRGGFDKHRAALAKHPPETPPGGGRMP